jgi:hypothetical protein
MSDGPHRSLPMRSGWKRVAECGDNRAFAPEEISNAIIPALEQDCRDEIPPAFLDALCTAFREQEASLFKDQMGQQLEALRRTAGHGIGRTLLEHAIQVSESGKTGLDVPLKAMTDALTDRAARGARQVEEHYCRAADAPRAHDVRARIEEAIGTAAIDGLARRILKLDPGPSGRPRLKKQGLDDGVWL